MNFKPALVLLALVAGCSSHVEAPPRVAQRLLPHAASGNDDQRVEMRHFYLLSPGPNATLVVTRSDVQLAAH